MSAAIETDVLIVGSGPAGSSAALFLSTHGIEKGTPQHLMGQTSFCTSMAGEELARSHTWGTHPDRLADYTLASPMAHLDVPQSLMAPILLGHAAERGTRVRLDTEYLELEQDDDGVTATVQDRISGSTYQVRAKYLIGADGGRSKVFADLGLPSEGRMDVAGSMDIVLHADLTRYVAHRPSVPYLGPAAGRRHRRHRPRARAHGAPVDGVADRLRLRHQRAAATDRRGRGDPHRPQPDRRRHGPPCAFARRRLGQQSGTPGRSPTGACSAWATPGTAIRRPTARARTARSRTPTTWPGSSRSSSRAGPTRRCGSPTTPSARPWQADRHARQQVDRGVRADLRRARPAGTSDPALMRERMQASKEATPEAAEQREKLRRAIELENHQFNAHGVEMNHSYRSDAVVPDGTDEPAWGPDPEGYYDPTTWPGARLPHVWLEHEGERVSSLDLAGKGASRC